MNKAVKVIVAASAVVVLWVAPASAASRSHTTHVTHVTVHRAPAVPRRHK